MGGFINKFKTVKNVHRNETKAHCCSYYLQALRKLNKNIAIWLLVHNYAPTSAPRRAFLYKVSSRTAK